MSYQERKSCLLLQLLLVFTDTGSTSLEHHTGTSGEPVGTQLWTILLLSLVTDHELWLNSESPQDWGWSGLPCLNSPSPASSSGLLGWVERATPLAVQVSPASVLYFVWHSQSQSVCTSSQPALNEMHPSSTRCAAEKHRPGVTAEILRSRNMGCNVGKHTQGMIRDWVLADSRDTVAKNGALMVI